MVEKHPGGFAGYDVAKAGMIRMTTRLASLAKTAGICVNCLAPGWIATQGVQSYWESLTPAERAERQVPSRLLTTDQISEVVVRLAEDRSLAGRVLVWWSEDTPRLIEWAIEVTAISRPSSELVCGTLLEATRNRGPRMPKSRGRRPVYSNLPGTCT
jgi:Enoyl-(Acyl carrier protein) reductase